jgi:hypothetical protein
MCPTEGELRGIAGGIGDQTVETGVAIDLRHAAVDVAPQMLLRMFMIS